MKRVRRESITLAELDANHDLAAKLARRKGGVKVVDEHGNLHFTLSIPSTPLPIDHCPGCRCKERRKRARR